MYVNSCAFWLSLTILQLSADNADTLSRLLDRIGSLCNVLLTAFEKLKELNRHGVPLTDLKGNIQTLIGSVETIVVVLWIANTDAEILGSLGSRWRTTLAVVELCDSCVQKKRAG